MVKFAWDTEKSIADLLVDLDEAGIVVCDTMFLTNVVDEADFATYNVICYTDDPEDFFPDSYDEAQATEEFLKLINTIIVIGV